MEFIYSLPSSQKLGTGTHPEPDKTSLQLTILLYLNIRLHLFLRLSSDSFLHISFPIKNLCAFPFHT
jgi:hypothetical protein